MIFFVVITMQNEMRTIILPINHAGQPSVISIPALRNGPPQPHWPISLSNMGILWYSRESVAR